MEENDREINKGLKTLARGSFIVLIGIILSKILSYGYRIIVARGLGPEIYGIFSLAVIVASWLIILFKFGFTGGIARFIPFYIGKKNPEKARFVYKTSVAILSVSGIVAGILLFLFSEEIAVGIFNNLELTHFLKIFAIVVPLNIILDAMLSFLLACERIGWHSFIYNILQNFVKVISLGLLILIGLKADAILFSYLISVIISLIVAYFVSVKILKSLSNKFISGKEKKNIFKDLFSYSWPLLFFGFTWQLFHWTDTLMIGYLQNAEQVGFYNAAVPIATLFNFTSALFIQLFFPLITKEYSKGKIEVIKQLSKQVGKWIFLINLPILILFAIFPEFFIRVLFGGQYLSAVSSLRILLIGTFVNSIFIISDRIITMLGKTKIILANIVVITIINIILNYFLIGKYGIVGASIATSISFVLLNAILIYQADRYTSIVPMRRKMINVFLAGIVSGVIVYSLKIFADGSLISDVMLLIMFCLLYVILTFVLRCYDRNDLMIIKSVRNKLFG